MFTLYLRFVNILLFIRKKALVHLQVLEFSLAFFDFSKFLTVYFESESDSDREMYFGRIIQTDFPWRCFWVKFMYHENIYFQKLFFIFGCHWMHLITWLI